jgi:alpha-glucosidase
MKAYSSAGRENGVGGLSWWQQAVFHRIYPLSFQDSNGDVLGDLPVPSEQARDRFERRVPGFGLNRDPERASMRWDGAKAGFTTGEPWLPVGDDVEVCNVEVQRKDKRSLLALYRRLLDSTATSLRFGRGATSRPTGAPTSSPTAALSTAEGSSSPSIRADAAEEVAVPGAGEIELSTQAERADERVDGSVRLRRIRGSSSRSRLGNDHESPLARPIR